MIPSQYFGLNRPICAGRYHDGVFGQPAKPLWGLAIRTSPASAISHCGIDCARRPELAAFAAMVRHICRSIPAKKAAPGEAI
jgi:hypothetical protein